MNVPTPGRVPVADLAWSHASRLLPARFQALECFERLLEPGSMEAGVTLARLSSLTTMAGDIATAIEEVRFHRVHRYRQEGVTLPMDLDYRALALQIQGRVHDIRGKAMARSPWSAIYAPDSYALSQAFAEALVQAGSRGLAYASVRSPGGPCAALFDPNLVRACRHHTYLAFRWDGRAVSRVVEKRILRLA